MCMNSLEVTERVLDRLPPWVSFLDLTLAALREPPCPCGSSSSTFPDVVQHHAHACGADAKHVFPREESRS